MLVHSLMGCFMWFGCREGREAAQDGLDAGLHERAEDRFLAARGALRSRDAEDRAAARDLRKARRREQRARRLAGGVAGANGGSDDGSDGEGGGYGVTLGGSDSDEPGSPGGSAPSDGDFAGPSDGSDDDGDGADAGERRKKARWEAPREVSHIGMELRRGLAQEVVEGLSLAEQEALALKMLGAR